MEADSPRALSPRRGRSARHRREPDNALFGRRIRERLTRRTITEWIRHVQGRFRRRRRSPRGGWLRTNPCPRFAHWRRAFERMNLQSSFVVSSDLACVVPVVPDRFSHRLSVDLATKVSWSGWVRRTRTSATKLRASAASSLSSVSLFDRRRPGPLRGIAFARAAAAPLSRGPVTESERLLMRPPWTDPIEHGIVTNWDDMEKIWHHTVGILGAQPRGPYCVKLNLTSVSC